MEVIIIKLNLKKLSLLLMFAVPCLQGMQQPANAMIKLQTDDKRIFVIEKAVAECSATIKNMCEDSATTEILLPAQITKEDVVIFMPYLKMVYQIRNKQTTPEQLQQELQKETDGNLYAICQIANYFDVPEILEEVIEEIANRLKSEESTKKLLETGSFDLPFPVEIQVKIARKIIGYWDMCDLILYWDMRDEMYDLFHDGIKLRPNSGIPKEIQDYVDKFILPEQAVLLEYLKKHTNNLVIKMGIIVDLINPMPELLQKRILNFFSKSKEQIQPISKRRKNIQK